MANGTATGTITAKSLTITGITANDKVYDGNVIATLTGTAVLSGVVSGDNVSLSGTAAASFADKNVANTKPVTVTGYSLGGNDKSNYIFSQPTGLTANITARSLTITATGTNKPYDGTTAASVTLGDNRVTSDVLTTAYTAAAFADKNVGNGKTVSVTGITVTGIDAANYTFNATTSSTANITAKALTVSAAGTNKTYDGTTAATVTLGDNKVSGDVITTAYTAAAFALVNATLATSS